MKRDRLWKGWRKPSDSRGSVKALPSTRLPLLSELLTSHSAQHIRQVGLKPTIDNRSRTFKLQLQFFFCNSKQVTQNYKNTAVMAEEKEVGQSCSFSHTTCLSMPRDPAITWLIMPNSLQSFKDTI